MVGISLDEGGWSVLKPFLADAKVSYCILLGDQETAQRFRIKNLPDTFLIDQYGRVAAVYRAGLVDKDDVEANIRTFFPNTNSLLSSVGAALHVIPPVAGYSVTLSCSWVAANMKLPSRFARRRLPPV